MFLKPCTFVPFLACLLFIYVTASNAQDETHQSVPQPPQPIISKVEFIVGAGIIYGGGNDLLRTFECRILVSMSE
jgi:hypothetical protein